MEYRTDLKYDLANGESFLARPIQSTQNVISLSLFKCENITADATFELYAGPNQNSMEPVKYFNPELGVYETVSFTIVSGEDSGLLRVKDIALGEYFQLKYIGGGVGKLRKYKIIA